MRVVISTDLEGISGIICWEQTRDFSSPMYQSARGLLMGDVNACIEGCLTAGATDIIVEDGHGGGFNFIPEQMHPGARYFTGRSRSPFMCWADMYAGIDAVILLGYHAMAGTTDGILRHTQSSRGGNRYWYNERESGEMAQDALVFGDFDIPTIMVSGDTATCREARAFFGPEIVTVDVKKGYGEEFGVLLAPTKAHELIAYGAAQALKKAREFQPHRIETPIKGRLRFADKSVADGFHPSVAKRVDDYTFEATIEQARYVHIF